MDRKFYIFEQQTIQYQWSTSGFFRSSPAKWYKIMLYEESGNYYELLTGQFLGTKKSDGYNQYVFSNEFGYSVPLSGCSIRRYAHSVTAQDFARQAREYMEEKNKIIPHINRRFEEWRIANKKRIEQERAKRCSEEKKKAEDLQNTDWLSNLLDKRNKRK